MNQPEERKKTTLREKEFHKNKTPWNRNTNLTKEKQNHHHHRHHYHHHFLLDCSKRGGEIIGIYTAVLANIILKKMWRNDKNPRYITLISFPSFLLFFFLPFYLDFSTTVLKSQLLLILTGIIQISYDAFSIWGKLFCFTAQLSKSRNKKSNKISFCWCFQNAQLSI